MLVAFGLTTGGLGHPTAPTVTAKPSTRPRPADPPHRASPEPRADAHHRAAGADHRAHRLDHHPSHQAAGRQRADHRCWSVSAQAPATAGTTTSTEAFSTFDAATTQPAVTGPTTPTTTTTTGPTTTTGAESTTTEAAERSP
jgi:hypothetical protein